jgi:branched-chain amino acid aminotransferase
LQDVRRVVGDDSAEHLRDGYVRLIVTRGVGNLGLNPAQCKRAQRIIIARPSRFIRSPLKNGLAVVTCDARRGPAALNPAVKSLNYLNNVMAQSKRISPRG